VILVFALLISCQVYLGLHLAQYGSWLGFGLGGLLLAIFFVLGIKVLLAGPEESPDYYRRGEMDPLLSDGRGKKQRAREYDDEVLINRA
jgi:hypothetical protein